MLSLRSRRQNPDAVIERIRNIHGSGRIDRYAEWITETARQGAAAIATELRDTVPGHTRDGVRALTPHPNQMTVRIRHVDVSVLIDSDAGRP